MLISQLSVFIHTFSENPGSTIIYLHKHLLSILPFQPSSAIFPNHGRSSQPISPLRLNTLPNYPNPPPPRALLHLHTPNLPLPSQPHILSPHPHHHLARPGEKNKTKVLPITPLFVDIINDTLHWSRAIASIPHPRIYSHLSNQNQRRFHSQHHTKLHDEAPSGVGLRVFMRRTNVVKPVARPNPLPSMNWGRIWRFGRRVGARR